MPIDQPPDSIAERASEMRMTLGEHLEDLRHHILWAIGGVVVAMVGTFYFGFTIIAWLAQPLLQAMEMQGIPPQTYTFGPTAGFDVYLRVSLISAAVVSAPWLVYQVWRFVVLGLREHEQRLIHILWPFSLVMTVLGVLFTYYILLPVCLLFFFTFSTYYPPVEVGDPGFMMNLMQPDKQVEAGDVPEPADEFTLHLPVYDSDPAEAGEGQVWIARSEHKVKMMLGGQVRVLMLNSERLMSPMPDVGQYVKFASILGLGIVIAFQLPVIMLIVGWTGLVDPRMIARMRKYAIFVCFAASAVITPTDLLSMFVLAVPLYTLFELGLALMRLSFRRESP